MDAVRREKRRVGAGASGRRDAGCRHEAEQPRPAEIVVVVARLIQEIEDAIDL